jgi:hypothetical protein
MGTFLISRKRGQGSNDCLPGFDLIAMSPVPFS